MLKEQIEFLKQELVQRNHTIDCLLATLEECVKAKNYYAHTLNDRLKISKDKDKQNNVSSIDDLIGKTSKHRQTFNANFDSSKLDKRNVTIRRRNGRKNENFTNDGSNQELTAGGTSLSVDIIGDSMLNNISSRGISKKDTINVLGVAGLKSSYIMDHVNPSIKRESRCHCMPCWNKRPAK